MAPVKFSVFFALVLILNFHWAHSQYFGGYGGHYPVYGGYEDDSDLDVILPFLLIAMCGRGGGFGGHGGGYGGYPPIPYAYGGNCGGCGCGCGGCGGGCGGCRGGCGGCCGGCGCGC